MMFAFLLQAVCLVAVVALGQRSPVLFVITLARPELHWPAALLTKEEPTRVHVRAG